MAGASVAVVVSLAAVAPGCVRAPCCAVDDECAGGFLCFEGRCAAHCDDDSQCNEGELCDVRAVSAGGSGHVCHAKDASNAVLDACPYPSANNPGSGP